MENILRTFTNILLVIAISILLNACSDSDNSVNVTPIEWRENSSTYNVVYNDNTIVFEQSDLADLVAEDANKHTYSFLSSNSKAKLLKKGDIIIIYGKALRKVSKINLTNNNIVVETEYTTMNKASKSGKIAWDYGCEFTANAKPVVMMKGQEYNPVINGEVLNWNFTANGMDYTIEMNMNGDNADVKFQIEKKMGDNAGGKFIAEGTIQRFRSISSMNYNNSSLSDFSNTNDGLSGDLKLSLVVAASGNDGVTLELPVILLKYPFLVGPIPCVINVKAVVLINAVVPFAASSQVTAKFKYNSKTGFKYAGGGFESQGNIGSYSMDKDKAQTGSPSAISANFGIGFPRLELSMFGEVVVPWIQTAFLIGGYYNFNPACQEAKAMFQGSYGVDFSFLGFEKSFSTKLWEQEKVLLQAGACK